MYFLREVIIFVIIAKAFGQDTGCVTYDFEEDFDTLFGSGQQVCTGQETWVLGSYDDISVPLFNEQSSNFISPAEQSQSCISSFTFPMTLNGVVEINLYMRASGTNDQLIVLVQASVPLGNDFPIATPSFLSISSEGRWHTMQITIDNVSQNQNVQGYVSYYKLYFLFDCISL